jgi:hypothetical protein
MKTLTAIAGVALSLAEPTIAQQQPILVNRYATMMDAIEVFATSYCQARSLGASSDEAMNIAVIDKINKFLSNYTDEKIGLQEYEKIDEAANAKQSILAVQKLCPELL